MSFAWADALRMHGDPRPLMVQLGRYTSKNYVMESLYKLRGADRNFKSVVIAHDMTLAEREDCKRLVTEANRTLQQHTRRGNTCTGSGASQGK